MRVALLLCAVALATTLAAARGAGHDQAHFDVKFRPDGEAVLARPPHKVHHRGVHRNTGIVPPHLAAGQAPATVLLHDSLFQKVINEAVPLIIAVARNITIPGQSEKHFSFGDIKLSEFNIGSVTINFDTPNLVVVNMNDLSMSVPQTDFKVFTKILFAHVSCSGDFWASLSGTNMVAKFPLVNNNGKLGFGDGTATVTFGSLNIGHKMHDLLCKVGADIVQLFIGNIDNLIKSTIEKDISPMATKALNGMFSKLSDKVDLPILAPPTSTGDSISITIDLLNLPKDALKPQAPKSKALRGKRTAVGTPFPTRDAELFVDATSFNAVFEHFTADGHLNVNHKLIHVNTSLFELLVPAVFNACPYCELALSANWLNSPVAVFNNSCVLSFTGCMATFEAFNKTGGNYVDLFTINLNGTFSANNFTVVGPNTNVVDFQVQLIEVFMALAQSNVGNIDVSAISSLVDWILNTIVVADFNKDFTGLPIGPFGSITISDMELSFAGSQLATGFDVGLPSV